MSWLGWFGFTRLQLAAATWRRYCYANIYANTSMAAAGGVMQPDPDPDPLQKVD
ncbi:hypothetical protein [Thalassospira alkalitolerans]|uniref:hypothetical protein n=1 Tax=Thalassospira alkalitolerans TaxID=1293890 RepID=UPI003AA957E2